MEQDRPEAVAARERQEAMVEQLRKAELVRDRLASLQQLVGSFPDGHNTRVLLEHLHLERRWSLRTRTLTSSMPSTDGLCGGPVLRLATGDPRPPLTATVRADW